MNQTNTLDTYKYGKINTHNDNKTEDKSSQQSKTSWSKAVNELMNNKLHQSHSNQVFSKYGLNSILYGIFGLLTLIVLILLFILLKKYYRRCKECVEDSNLEEGTFNMNNLDSNSQHANSNGGTNQPQQTYSADDSDSSSTSSESSTQSVENSYFENYNQYLSLKARPKGADNDPDKNSVTTPDYENVVVEKNEDYVNMVEAITPGEDLEDCETSSESNSGKSDDGSVHYSTVVFNKATK